MSISWEIPRLRFFWYTLYMHPINISRITVQHMCNWKGIQILTICLISKGLLFFDTPCTVVLTPSDEILPSAYPSCIFNSLCFIWQCSKKLEPIRSRFIERLAIGESPCTCTRIYCLGWNLKFVYLRVGLGDIKKIISRLLPRKLSRYSIISR
jgi:hypothetical protein